MSDELSITAGSAAKPGIWRRACQFAIVRILIGLLIISVVLVALQFGFGFLARNPAIGHFFGITMLPAWIGIVAALFAYCFFVRWIEKRPVPELGARGAIPELLIGISLGALMFAATIAILTLLDCFHIVGFDSWRYLIPALAGAAVAAVTEEILFRGIIFRITEESLGTWLALAISALLFGAVHLLNPHSSLQGGIAIVLEAGIFLAAAYLVTRRLWLVIGAHFGWNFTEGGIFGAAISGNASRGIIKGTVTGPDYLSGGIFGVEASVVAIGICLLVALVLLRYARTRTSFVRPFWRR